MQNRVAPLHGSPHAVGIAHIAHENFKFTGHIWRAPIEPTPRTEGVVQNEGTHVMSSAHQGLGEMGTDETVSACYQNARHLIGTPTEDVGIVIFTHTPAY